MNIGLVLQSWFVPRLRVAWSFGRKNFAAGAGEFFTEHAHDPLRCRWRWGWDCFSASCRSGACKWPVAATVAHWLRLNKAITLPRATFPFRRSHRLSSVWLYSGPLAVHRRSAEAFAPRTDARHKGLGIFLAMARRQPRAGRAVVAALGTVTTYAVARLVRRK
jgi:hypothetical protein